MICYEFSHILQTNANHICAFTSNLVYENIFVMFTPWLINNTKIQILKQIQFKILHKHWPGIKWGYLIINTLWHYCVRGYIWSESVKQTTLGWHAYYIKYERSTSLQIKLYAFSLHHDKTSIPGSQIYIIHW